MRLEVGRRGMVEGDEGYAGGRLVGAEADDETASARRALLDLSAARRAPARPARSPVRLSCRVHRPARARARAPPAHSYSSAPKLAISYPSTPPRPWSSPPALLLKLRYPPPAPPSQVEPCDAAWCAARRERAQRMRGGPRQVERTARGREGVSASAGEEEGVGERRRTDVDDEGAEKNTDEDDHEPQRGVHGGH